MKKINLVSFVTALSLLLTASSVYGQRTAMVSVNSTGTNGGNNYSYEPPVMSANGRFVAFASFASDLVTNDTNGKMDVFVRDMQTGVTSLVSVNSQGTQSGGDTSYAPAMSGDGRLVVFWSRASDLVPNDTNNLQDLFVRDLVTGTTTLIRASGAGSSTNNGSVQRTPKISADGRYIFFNSWASDLVPGTSDTNASIDIFVRDMQTGLTSMVSVNFGNASSANAGSDDYQISADGRFVAFSSVASTLVTDDTNSTDDVYSCENHDAGQRQQLGRPGGFAIFVSVDQRRRAICHLQHRLPAG